MDTQDKVTIQQASTLNHVTRKTIYTWINKGLLQVKKEGNRSYVSLAKVQELCNQKGTQKDTVNGYQDTEGIQKDTQQDTRVVTLDREHYEGLLIRLGQLESEKRYLLEYKGGLEAKDKELAEAKENLTSQAQKIDETKTALSRANSELKRLIEIKQDAEAKARALEEQQAKIKAKEKELEALRAENEKLKTPWFLRWLKRK